MRTPTRFFLKRSFPPWLSRRNYRVRKLSGCLRQPGQTWHGGLIFYERRLETDSPRRSPLSVQAWRFTDGISRPVFDVVPASSESGMPRTKQTTARGARRLESCSLIAHSHGCYGMIGPRPQKNLSYLRAIRRAGRANRTKMAARPLISSDRLL